MPEPLKMLKNLAERFWKIAFPRTCVVTGTPLERDDYEFVSKNALAGTRFVGKNGCEFCGAPFDSADKTCFCCGNRPFFDDKNVRACCAVALDDAILELVHAYKYRFVRGVARDLAKICGNADGFYDFLRGATLVPVPLWRERFQFRGFNQSEMLARELAKIVPETRVVPALIRHRDTGTQTRLTAEQRAKNIRGAFSISPKISIDAGTRYIVIDDVFTTGATLNECAKTLRSAGAKRVDVATFVRAMKNRSRGNAEEK